MICLICFEEFEYLLQCPFCNVESCHSCWVTWFLSLENGEPTCYKCQNEWPQDFMENNFEKESFIEIRDYRESILLDQFRCYFEMLHHRYLTKLEMQRLKRKRLKIFRESVKLSYSNKPKIIRKYNSLHIKEATLIIDIRYLEIYIEDPLQTPEMLQQNLNAEKNLDFQFTGFCPMNTCDGKLDNNYSCTKCLVKVCNICKEEKNENHQCQKEIVTSIKQIAEDCKLCPKCHSPIYRISGCNNMFCTNCKITFDYVTMKIYNVYIPHNPHNFQDTNLIESIFDNTLQMVMLKRPDHYQCSAFQIYKDSWTNLEGSRLFVNFLRILLAIDGYCRRRRNYLGKKKLEKHLDLYEKREKIKGKKIKKELLEIYYDIDLNYKILALKENWFNDIMDYFRYIIKEEKKIPYKIFRQNIRDITNKCINVLGVYGIALVDIEALYIIPLMHGSAKETKQNLTTEYYFTF